jgi:hypothetical protein
MTVPAVGVVIQLETDPRSSTVSVRTGVFSEISAHNKHQVVKAIVNTVFGRGERTCTNVFSFSLCSSLLFVITVPLGAHVSEDHKLLLSISPFPPRLLALVGPVRSLGVIRAKCYEAVLSGGSEFGAVKSCRS